MTNHTFVLESDLSLNSFLPDDYIKHIMRDTFGGKIIDLSSLNEDELTFYYVGGDYNKFMKCMN